MKTDFASRRLRARRDELLESARRTEPASDATPGEHAQLALHHLVVGIARGYGALASAASEWCAVRFGSGSGADAPASPGASFAKLAAAGGYNWQMFVSPGKQLGPTAAAVARF